jgi:hypothetical protein
MILAPMQDLLIEKSVRSPFFKFLSRGIMIIEGKAISLDAKETFMPAMQWCRKLKISEVYVLIKLDCINMASMREMVRLLYKLQSNPIVSDVFVSWYYDAEDSEMALAGNLIEELIPELNFEYFQL